MEILNARVESTRLGFDQGRMSFWLYLDYGGLSQGWGGYVLDPREGDISPTPPFGIVAIRKTLEVVGVESWESLVGKYVRAKCCNERVEAIGNILEDEWLDLAELSAAMSRGDK